MQRFSGRPTLPIAAVFCAAWLGAFTSGCRTGDQPGAPAGAGGGDPGGSAAQAAFDREALKGTDSSVLDVVAYYGFPIHWRWSEDRTRVHGLIVGALYLMGPRGKGVFGDGVIRPKLYVRDRLAPQGEPEWKLVKEWRYTPRLMLPFRTKKPSVQGNGYMLPLDWSDLDSDLSNREIRLVITYERTDGMPSPRPSTKDLRVPAKGA